MKNFLLLFIINLILVLIQTAFLPQLLGNGLYINLILALGYSLMLVDQVELGLFSSLIGSILLDILGLRILGISSLVIMLFLYTAFYIKRYFIKSASVPAILFVVNYYVLFFIYSPKGFVMDKAVILGSIYSFICLLGFYYIVSRIWRNIKV